MKPLNQTTSAQGCGVPLFRIDSQVALAVYDGRVWSPISQTKESGTCVRDGSGTEHRWICRASASCERAGRSLQPDKVQESETVAVKGMPNCVRPEGPKRLMRGPIGVQWSYQKLALLPFPIPHLMKRSAKHRSLRRAFQIHEDWAFSSKLQTLLFLNLFVLHQAAHRY